MSISLLYNSTPLPSLIWVRPSFRLCSFALAALFVSSLQSFLSFFTLDVISVPAFGFSFLRFTCYSNLSSLGY
ncbi:hypothetical protein L6164_016013 [Bauhinia variegata]|uniref:Uncharacterized protein n=1 Tax=Bauhinia variegata TaxID=167791 RepID=A0ACB9NPP0_BAUVA|nr:hypothetical protein L6164_016013 [Bauhinia variegata]